EEISALILEKIKDELEQKEEKLTSEKMRLFERMMMLRTIDRKWVEHIDSMDQLRTGIHLRSYGQINPLREYQNEGLQMCEDKLGTSEDDTAKYVLKTEHKSDEKIKREHDLNINEIQTGHGKQTVKIGPADKEGRVGRNDPSPCASGKKYKNCPG